MKDTWQGWAIVNGNRLELNIDGFPRLLPSRRGAVRYCEGTPFSFRRVEVTVRLVSAAGSGEAKEAER